MRGNCLVRVVGILDLSGAGNRRRGRQCDQSQLAVSLTDLPGLASRFGIDCEEASHGLALGLTTGDEHRGQGELRGVLPRHLHGQVVGRLNSDRLQLRGGHVLRQTIGCCRSRSFFCESPAVTAGVKISGITHVVRREKVTLNLEHILRVAQVPHQVGRDICLGFHGSGVDLRPGIEDRIVIVPLEQTHRSVVGIDDGLHRVTHVVDGVSLDVLSHRLRARINRAGGQRLVLGIGVGIRGRVGVNNPHQTLRGRRISIGIDNRRVSLLFQSQVRRNLCHSQQGITVIQDLGFFIRLRGEEDIG